MLNGNAQPNFIVVEKPEISNLYLNYKLSLLQLCGWGSSIWHIGTWLIKNAFIHHQDTSPVLLYWSLDVSIIDLQIIVVSNTWLLSLVTRSYTVWWQVYWTYNVQSMNIHCTYNARHIVQYTILSDVQRKIGYICLEHVKERDVQTLQSYFEAHADENGLHITDGWKGYYGLNKRRFYHFKQTHRLNDFLNIGWFFLNCIQYLN